MRFYWEDNITGFGLLGHFEVYHNVFVNAIM